jgi:hypothetical protein
VPPFGHEDSALLDPRQWPDSVELAGKTYFLSIRVARGDGTYAEVESISDVPESTELHLFYEAHGTPGELVPGPNYYWNRYGRVWLRNWTEQNKTTTQATYPSGRLLEYGMRSHGSTPYLDVTEDFDAEGRLLALAYSNEGQLNRTYWLKGQPVPRDTWWKTRWDLFDAAREEGRFRRKW